MVLTSRFEQAFQYAFRIHRNQVRKGSLTPYITHLLAVSALVIEDGGSEDEAIAALLHDGPEDQGGIVILDEIRSLFGDNVANIVAECTDSYDLPKPAWRKRKEDYLEHLRYASIEVRRVSMADKIHNARSILSDLRRSGESVWSRFNGGRKGTLWYYHSLLEIFRASGPSPMLAAFEDVLEKTDELLGYVYEGEIGE